VLHLVAEECQELVRGQHGHASVHPPDPTAGTGRREPGGAELAGANSLFMRKSNCRGIAGVY
jgi:hypothetical protein